MKNKIIIFIAVLCMGNWQYLKTEAVSVVVPKQYLIEKASLVLYMLDEMGNQCVGMCQLNETFEQRTILQEDVRIQQFETLAQLSEFSIEISDCIYSCDNHVVLHIEFDNDIRVVRVLIVKDNLLASDSFDVVSIPDDLEDEDDALSNLIEGIDSSAVATTSGAKQDSSLSRYALYAKIYCMMQYKHVTGKMRSLTAWLCKKR